MNTLNHGWGIGFGWLIPILIIVILFYTFQDKKEETSTAQDILDKRYASGGISNEEYKEKSQLLKEQTLKG